MISKQVPIIGDFLYQHIHLTLTHCKTLHLHERENIKQVVILIPLVICVKISILHSKQKNDTAKKAMSVCY